ncbi:MAG: hypothetical protein WDA42_05470 [Candidatus Bathyarchaeia archaeon]
MRETTIGQLLLENALPPESYQPGTELNKKGVKKLFQHLANNHPDQYRHIAQRLNEVGSTAAYMEGTSFDIDDFKTPGIVLEARHRIRKKLARVLSNPTFTPKQRNDKIIEVVGDESNKLLNAIVDNNRSNPLTEQILSGARGNAVALKRLIGGDLLYLNHRDEPIPLVVESSYSEGLKPAEYWAATYGARKGLAEGKLGVGKGGYLSKLLNQLSHKLMVTAIDSPDEMPEGAVRGLPVDIDDNDNIGALLAENIGGHKRNTIITPKVLADIKKTGRDTLLIRSPLVGGPPDGGLYARDVGIRELGRLADLGSLPGLTAAQAAGERLAQTALSSKHAGGVAGGSKTIGGFPAIEQMINVPKHYKDGATHAQVDGVVTNIEENPLGGWHVFVGNEQHFVAPGLNPTVKRWDNVEAGDMISEGLPNPSEFVKHKGIGEGSRQFVKHFLDVFKGAGMPANRRNIELLTRGFINHVEFDEDYENWLPGDVTSYSGIERNWRVRDRSQLVKPSSAINKYLETPVLHYTIGTRITPSVLSNLNKYGIKQVTVHDDPPPFSPLVVRGSASVSYDDNWLTRLLGSQQQKVLLTAARQGDVADMNSLSYVPAKAQGESFGKDWPTRLLADYK